MNILSIQSHVTFGHVGNSAAVFPLQRAGHEVWPIHTVNFSNHTGYGDWGGPMIPAEEVTAIVDGIEKRGAFPRIDAILSGYQGGPDIAGAIVDAVNRIKAVNPSALYACDPVMGNAKSGCFVSDEIPPLLRDKVVPVADIITPNQFELGYLTDSEVGTLKQTLAAVKRAQEIGPKTVLVTSVQRPETSEDEIEMLAVDGERAFLVSTPKHRVFRLRLAAEHLRGGFPGTAAHRVAGRLRSPAAAVPGHGALAFTPLSLPARLCSLGLCLVFLVSRTSLILGFAWSRAPV